MIAKEILYCKDCGKVINIGEYYDKTLSNIIRCRECSDNVGVEMCWCGTEPPLNQIKCLRCRYHKFRKWPKPFWQKKNRIYTITPYFKRTINRINF